MSVCQGRFSELGNQLQKVILGFVNNENLCKLLYYKDSNPLSNPPVPDPYGLINTQIFPLAFRPPTNEETIYISVYFGRFDKATNNPYFKRGRLYINVLVHRNLWQIDGGVRIYEIMNEIDMMLNREDLTGALSKDWFHTASYLPVNDFFMSYTLEYQFYDS